MKEILFVFAAFIVGGLFVNILSLIITAELYKKRPLRNIEIRRCINYMFLYFIKLVVVTGCVPQNRYKELALFFDIYIFEIIARYKNDPVSDVVM